MWLISPKLIYSCIPIRILTRFFIELEKIQTSQEEQRIINSKDNSEEKNKGREIAILDIKTQLKGT